MTPFSYLGSLASVVLKYLCVSLIVSEAATTQHVYISPTSADVIVSKCIPDSLICHPEFERNSFRSRKYFFPRRLSPVKRKAVSCHNPTDHFTVLEPQNQANQRVVYSWEIKYLGSNIVRIFGGEAHSYLSFIPNKETALERAAF